MTADDCSPSGESPKYKYVQRSKEPNIIDKIGAVGYSLFVKPAIWFRETIVTPNQKQYPWYHQQFPRVKNIDECYTDDIACIYEANMQFKRDKEVDSSILLILRNRMDDCVREEYPDHIPRCLQLKEEYEVAAGNWYAKYGEMGFCGTVIDAYTKQKHRLLWERRHGPIGSGMRTDPYDAEVEAH